jgi:uncharacterized protein YeaO (DUF488 family)
MILIKRVYVTLLYSAHDTGHNNGLALMHFVQQYVQTPEISR